MAVKNFEPFRKDWCNLFKHKYKTVFFKTIYCSINASFFWLYRLSTCLVTTESKYDWSKTDEHKCPSMRWLLILWGVTLTYNIFHWDEGRKLHRWILLWGITLTVTIFSEELHSLITYYNYGEIKKTALLLHRRILLWGITLTVNYF